MKGPYPRTIGIEDGEESKLQGPENILNKIINKFQPNERNAYIHTEVSRPPIIQNQKKILSLTHNQYTKSTGKQNNI